MIKWKLRVKDKRGNWHVHRFWYAEAAYRHWTLYLIDNTCERMEMWKLTRNVVATGLPEEEVWDLVQRWQNED